MNVPILWQRMDTYFHCNLPTPPQVKSGNTITCCQLQSFTKHVMLCLAALPIFDLYWYNLLLVTVHSLNPLTAHLAMIPDEQLCTVPKAHMELCCLCMNALYALTTCPCQTALMSNATPPPQSLIQSFPYKAHTVPYIWLITLSNKETKDNLVVLSGWVLHLAYQHLTVS